MIRILYGADTYSRTLALDRIRDELTAEGADVLRFDASVPMEELLAAIHTLPFMASRRLVIVEGLLARAGTGRRGGGRKRDSGSGRAAAGAPFWAPLADAAPGLPPTTELALIDGAVERDNPLLKALAPHAEARPFHPMPQRDVPGWIVAHAREAGVRMAPDATRLLAELCGPNLWAAAAEIEKLRLYAGDREATAGDVRALAASVRDESVFAMVDAVVEGRARDALRMLTELRADGEAGPRLLTMIARQYRLLILARELASGGLAAPDIGRRIGLTNEYALRKAMQQAARADMARLEAAMARVLDADVAMKRGEMTEDLALELLVADLARTA